MYVRETMRQLRALRLVATLSLVMTARANGVEPFEYLSEVFELLPTATTLETIEALLPWNLKPILDARRKRCQRRVDFRVNRSV